MSNNIVILMSTYNGARHLKTQLESLISQNYDNFLIYVHDDGSTDETYSNLRRYAADYQETIIFMNEQASNMEDYGYGYGYPDCFWYMLRNVPPADYYAFCDQDDVWMPDKISRAVKAFEQQNDSAMPMLYIHDYYVSDENLQILDIHRLQDCGKVCVTDVLFFTIAQGFSMVINEAMRQLVLAQEPEGKMLPHDGWLIWNALFSGKILYDDAVLAYYRRWGNAETVTGMGVLTQIRNTIEKEIKGSEFRRLCARGVYFAQICPDMDIETRQKWLLLAGSKPGFVNWCRRLLFPKRLRKNIFGEAALRLLFLLNIRADSSIQNTENES